MELLVCPECNGQDLYPSTDLEDYSKILSYYCKDCDLDIDPILIIR